MNRGDGPAEEIFWWALEAAKLSAIVVGGFVLITRLGGLESRVSDNERRLDEIARLAEEERASLAA